ncbi:MAG: hypothetical protein AMXMBFR4_11840 [Candidatus Hydrogenedentota bacterium]
MQSSEMLDLTLAQSRFWTGQQLYRDVPLYNMAHTFLLPADIQHDHFQRAFQAVVDRCDALRTVFVDENGAPKQRILPAIRYDVELLDFSQDKNPEETLSAWVRERVQRCFDLGGRLIDSVLIRLGPSRTVWYLNQHHIICDAWSTSLVFRWTGELYSLSISGKLTPAEMDRVFQNVPTFVEYSMRERQERLSDRGRDAEEFWRRKLAERREPICFYGRRAVTKLSRVVRVSRDLCPDRTQRLRRLATRPGIYHKSENVTLFNLFAVALLTWLHRVSGTDRLSIGMPHHNRHAAPFRDTVGLFIHVLPLQISLERTDTTRSVLRKIEREVSENLRHRPYYPDNPVQSRVFDVVLNYQTAQFPRFNGYVAEQQWVHPGTQAVPFVVHVHDFEGSGQLRLIMDFDCDLFDSEMREEAVSQFLTLLDGILDNPECPISELEILPETQRSRLLEWGCGREVELGGSSVVEAFEGRAKARGEATALRLCGQTVSYGELEGRSNGVARALVSAGVKRETFVGVCAGRTFEMVWGLLGVLKAGGAYVPLDAGYPEERLRYMVEDAGLRHVVVDGEAPEWLRGMVEHVVELRGMGSVEKERVGAKGGSGPGDLAYLMYTSGSTGRPKGVLVEHGGLWNLTRAQMEAFGIGEGSRVLQFASLSFDASVSEVFTALCSGAELVLAPQEVVSSPVRLTEYMRENGVTVATFPPVMLGYLEPEECGSLRTVVSAGDRCPAELARRWGGRCRFLNAYGPTEGTVCASLEECLGEYEGGVVPIGRALDNVRLYVLNEGRLAPLGVEGELWIGGKGVARGYWKGEELTGERFVPDRFAGEGRMYGTGDRVRWRRDGKLEYVGRLDGQVKVRGYRIELGEVEAALSGCEGVREAGVVARRDERGEAWLEGWVAGEVTKEAVLGRLRERVPGYLVPGRLTVLKELPKTASGKIDRNALASKSASRDGQPVTPRDNFEVQLIAIWEQTLGIQQIGIHENFFLIGGHSLKAAELLARIERHFGKTLPLTAIFDRPTIAGLAELLRSELPVAPWHPLVTIRPGGTPAPFFCVHPAGGHIFTYFHLAHQFDDDQPIYGLQDRSLDGTTPPHPSIEAMATEYIEHIRTVQPEGPYQLGGWSFGGYVAYEMAQQLITQGQEVSLLVMFDTPVPYLKPERFDAVEFVRNGILAAKAQLSLPFYSLPLIKDILFLIATIREEPNRRNSGLSAVRRLVRSLLSAIVGKAEMSRVVESNRHLLLIRQAPLLRTFNLMKWHDRIVRNYVPKPYPAVLTLLKCREKVVEFKVDKSPTLGWDRYVETVDVREIPGNHFTVFMQPYVQDVARRLRECLNEVRNGK